MNMVNRWKSRWWMAALAAVLLTTSPATGGLYTDGHADIGVGYDSDLKQLDLHFHAEGAIIDGVEVEGEFEPSAITIVVPLSVYKANHIEDAEGDWASDYRNVPESLGLVQGDKFWNLPEYPEDGVPWLGIGTEDIRNGIFKNNKIRITLFDMAAPDGGEFTLWNAGLGKKMQTYDGISESSDYLDVPTFSHGHWDYAFSKPGDYYLSLKAYGTLLDGDELLEASGTYHFQVVPEPSSLMLAGLGLGSVLSLHLVRRRRARRVSSRKA